LRLRAKPIHGADHEVKPLRWSDSYDLIWFIALAKEPLALMAKNGLHGIPFVKGFEMVEDGG
jgi:hypothetical protein